MILALLCLAIIAPAIALAAVVLRLEYLAQKVNHKPTSNL